MSALVVRLSEGVTIIQGDCLQCLPIQADAVVTDPPYGIGFNHSGGHGRFSQVGVTNASRQRGNHPVYGDDTPFDPTPWLSFDNVILWGADHFYPRLPDRGRWLAFNKLSDMEPWDSFSDVEFAWHSREGAARIFNMKWKGVACEKSGEDNGLRLHPTQKPVRLMVWCLDQAELPEGATVLDPYMGSGTTGVACIRTGRRFVGIEIDAGHFANANTRLQRELARGPLLPFSHTRTICRATQVPAP
jgi:DNA modification methylase